MRKSWRVLAGLYCWAKFCWNLGGYACRIAIGIHMTYTCQEPYVKIWRYQQNRKYIKYDRHTYSNKKHLKNIGPIRHKEPPHANSPDVASGTVARRLRIDVHDNDDNNNDDAWQRGPLWPHAWFWPGALCKTWRHLQNRKYLIYRSAVTEEPSHGHRQHTQKFGKVRPYVFWVMRSESDRQTNILITVASFSGAK